jgi:hypothetical protein
MGEARAEASMASTVARLPQSMAGRAERVQTRAYISRRGH